MRAQKLKGHLDSLLLATVEAGPAHGYAIIEEVNRRSDGAFDLAEGTVYPALHRLERANLLTSRASQFEGRRRRVYSLTAAGRARLEQDREEFRRFASAVTATLEGAP